MGYRPVYAFEYVWRVLAGKTVNLRNGTLRVSITSRRCSSAPEGWLTAW